jgi:hypothetical protein
MVHFHFQTEPLKEGEHTALPTWLLAVGYIGLLLLVYSLVFYLTVHAVMDITHR